MTAISSIALATNNGDIGGGEIMLFSIAEAINRLGIKVTVVAPERPGGVVDEAAARGFACVEVKARNRMEWMRGLRAWDAAERSGLLWCNGLVPALATAGRPGRIVHLHQLPRGLQNAALAVAQKGALRTLVPSIFVAMRVPRATVFPNWTRPVTIRSREPIGAPTIVGYLGRHSEEKGLPCLAEALTLIENRNPGAYRLVLAGEPRFSSADDQRLVADALSPIEHMIDRVGWVSPEAFFSQVDVAAFPSLVPESFGLVVAEAMSAKVPFVISDSGALAEVAGNAHPLVVPAGDASALADALERSATEVTQEMRDSSHQRWQQLFSPEAGQQRVADLLTSLGYWTGDI